MPNTELTVIILNSRQEESMWLHEPEASYKAFKLFARIGKVAAVETVRTDFKYDPHIREALDAEGVPLLEPPDFHN